MRPNAWPQLEFAPVTEAEHGLTSRVISRYPSSEAIIHIPSVATLTTVAGGTSNPDYIEVSELKDWFLDAKEGNDEVVVEETSTGFELYGAGDSDTLTAMGDVADAMIKGGAAADYITIKGATTNTSVYGGKAADSITFDRAVVGGVVYGDTNKDTITFTDKVSGGTIVDGGADDDSLTFNKRITSVTVRGGAARDAISVAESLDSLVDAGGDNDNLSISGSHSNLIAKGGEGADTLDLTLAGTGNRFYGGKDNDSIKIDTAAAVAVHGDNDNDTIEIASVVSGASVFGGDGADTLSLTAARAGSELVAKGNSGNDKIDGATSESDETIFGGQGNDTIISSADGSRTYYGDKGDDVISIGTNEASMVSGGEGADSINVNTVVTAADEKFHTVIGGAGVDTIVAAGSTDAKYATSLQYSSFAEFFTAGDVVDSITVGDGTYVKANVAEALSFIDIDSFDRVTMSAGTDGKRTIAAEGLIIATTDAVTTGSSIVFDSSAEDYIAGIDLSASATTAGSLIDNSAGNGATQGMILKGTEGDNTILGGDGADQITGGSGGDSLTGGEGADTIDAGTEGTDILVGGDGDDYLDLNTDLSKDDLITGGDGTDTIAFSHKSASTNILDRVSEVEVVKLENAKDNASITLLDTTIASGKSLTVTTNNASFTGKLTFNASAETDGSVNVTGGASADTITGSAGADTFNGGGGVDSITGGLGIDFYDFSTVANWGDTITDYGKSTATANAQNTTALSNEAISLNGEALAFSDAAISSNANSAIVGSYTPPSGDNASTFNATALKSGTTAAPAVVDQAYAQFLYNTDTGVLSFDADGTGTNNTAVTVATLLNGATAPTLTSTDLVIFA